MRYELVRYNVPNEDGEIIAPGALGQVEGKRVPVTIGFDPRQIIAMATLHETESGIEAEFGPELPSFYQLAIAHRGGPEPTLLEVGLVPKHPPAKKFVGALCELCDQRPATIMCQENASGKRHYYCQECADQNLVPVVQ
jgi:hypothetical protein